MVDAPPGLKEDGWSVQRPYRVILVLLIPAFGMLLVLSYLGAAVTNAKRAMFMHVRKLNISDGGPSRGTGSAPPPP